MEVAGPPPVIITPSSSPRTMQEDSLNGSCEKLLTNGHGDNGMMRCRLPQPRQRPSSSIVFNQSRPSNGYPTACARPPSQYEVHIPANGQQNGYDYYPFGPGLCDTRQEGFVESNVMANNRFVSRSPYIPDEMEMKKLWQQPVADSRQTFARHDQDRISSDALIACHLQEGENNLLPKSTTMDNGDSLLRRRELLKEHRARREQEENDRRKALEAQATEKGVKRERNQLAEHERLHRERRKLIFKQRKEYQERKDRLFAQGIAFEDARNAGLLVTRPIGYGSCRGACNYMGKPASYRGLCYSPFVCDCHASSLR